MKTSKLLALSVFLLIIIIISPEIYSQGVAINESGSAADASAMFDVKSTDKGMLIPRLTTSQRGQISSPATGLMIYQTDGTEGFYFYDGSGWLCLNAGVKPTPNEIADADGDSKIQVEESADEDHIRFDVAGSEAMTVNNSGNVGIGTTSPQSKLVTKDGTKMQVHIGANLPGVAWDQPTLALSRNIGGVDTYQSNVLTTISNPNLGGYSLLFQTTSGIHPIADWDANGVLTNRMVIGYNGRVGIGTTTPSNLFSVAGNADFSGNIGIGISSPDASAQLDVSSTSKGFLLPRMSTTEINAITSPSVGLMVYDTIENSVVFYNGSSWKNM